MAPQASDPEALAATLLEAERAVVLTGLRLGGAEGLDLTHAGGEWAERASLEAFLTDPARFWEYFYPTALAIAGRRPGLAHDALARLERAGMVSALVTQAVDRLHQRAGSLDPVEVYGTVLVLRCERCEERYGLPEAGALHRRVRRRGAALHHPRLRLPPAARGDALGRDPPAGGGRAGLGARRRRRRLHRPRLRPAHRADLASCPRCPSPAACRWCWSARPPPSTTATPHRVVRAPSAGVITAVADLIAARAR